jgi:hypothetical protein
MTVQSTFNQKMGTLGSRGGLPPLRKPIQFEGDVMKKILTALVAAASISAAAIAVSSPADAYWRGGGGWHGGYYGGGWRGGYGPGLGFAAGALLGGAIAAPYYYRPYGYGYYPYGGPYAAPCVWRRVWNGYGWVRACV